MTRPLVYLALLTIFSANLILSEIRVRAAVARARAAEAQAQQLLDTCEEWKKAFGLMAETNKKNENLLRTLLSIIEAQ